MNISIYYFTLYIIALSIVIVNCNIGDSSEVYVNTFFYNKEIPNQLKEALKNQVEIFNNIQHRYKVKLELNLLQPLDNVIIENEKTKRYALFFTDYLGYTDTVLEEILPLDPYLNSYRTITLEEFINPPLKYKEKIIGIPLFTYNIFLITNSNHYSKNLDLKKIYWGIEPKAFIYFLYRHNGNAIRTEFCKMYSSYIGNYTPNPSILECVTKIRTGILNHCILGSYFTIDIENLSSQKVILLDSLDIYGSILKGAQFRQRDGGWLFLSWFNEPHQIVERLKNIGVIPLRYSVLKEKTKMNFSVQLPRNVSPIPTEDLKTLYELHILGESGAKYNLPEFEKKCDSIIKGSL